MARKSNGRHQRDAKDGMAIIPWYWPDWRASKARARFISTKNWLAGWCYKELLDAHWGEKDCSLPPDDQDLAALAGVSLEDWLSVREEVLRHMQRTGTGRYRQRRSFFEWTKARKARATRRAVSEEANKARWKKEKEAVFDGSQQDPASIPRGSPPTPSPSPTLFTETYVENPANGGVAAKRGGGLGEPNGTPPPPPASVDVIDHDPTDPLQSEIARCCVELATITAAQEDRAPNAEDVREILRSVSLTPGGKTLNGLRSASKPWLEETLRSCGAFEADLRQEGT